MCDKDFKFLLEKIRRNKGVDFSLYREGTLRRRIDSRLRLTGCIDYLAYVAYLNRTPGEYDRLVAAATINVTEFFRNPETFRAIRQKVLPEITRNKPGRAIRAWCAGTSHGAETYSLAILFLQLIQEQNADYAVKILGTDIDPDCIAQAQAGIYAPSLLKTAGKNILDRYFSKTGNNYRVNDEVRQLTEFKPHNMLSAVRPFDKLDLILCRNVVIYFTKPLQAFVYDIFSRCLKPGGFLVLGKVESLGGYAPGVFATVDNKERIYRKM